MTTYDKVLKSVECGDLESLRQYFEGEWEREGLFGEMDEAGRNILAVASMLGRSAIVRELVRHGAQVNEPTARGYTSLHFAACWGHVDAVRTLLELGADTQTKTFKAERPVDLARKYSRTECADCLLLADAEQDLKSYIAFIEDMISESARKLTHSEKNICLGVCSEKSDWIQTFKNPTLLDLTTQRKDIEDKLECILSRLSAQSAAEAARKV